MDPDDFRHYVASRAIDRRYLRPGETWTSDTVDGETRRAAVADVMRNFHRLTARLLQHFLTMVAGWTRPIVKVMSSSIIEPAPLVGRLVDDLVNAPHAPTRAGVALLA